MAEFEPWLGNRNATDQQKNEYIRKLKAALIDASGFRIITGTYTGDGTASQAVSVSDGNINITYMQIASTSGTGYVVQAFDYSYGDFVFIDGAAPVRASTITLGTGSFTATDATYTNAAGVVYTYFGIGS